jgi:hypothetical protein
MLTMPHYYSIPLYEKVDHVKRTEHLHCNNDNDAKTGTIARHVYVIFAQLFSSLNTKPSHPPYHKLPITPWSSSTFSELNAGDGGIIFDGPKTKNEK